MPTAANLNLYRGWRSCVGWHCDDEFLFGECGEAKLIVSVSLGSTAVFRWKRQSCPDDEGHLCCLGHGDILVMDGQGQDEFLHRMDPGREQERINVTFRWSNNMFPPVPLFMGRSGMLFANVCARFICSCYWDFGVGHLAFFVLFGFFWVCCTFGDCLFFWPPYYVQNLGYFGCASNWARPVWTLFGWGITFVTS